jgi:hypothetical protein
VGQVGTLLHTDAPDWHKGHHVCGAHPWVPALVLVHVYLPCCLSYSSVGGLDHWLRRSNQGYYRPVVIVVALDIQDLSPSYAGHFFNNAIDDVMPAPFAEIGDTLYNWLHAYAP